MVEAPGLTRERQSFSDTSRVISDKRRAPTLAYVPPRCIHRAPNSARRAKSPVTRAKHSACRQKLIAGKATPRSSHPPHARTQPSQATSEAEKGGGDVRSGAWVAPRSAVARWAREACFVI